MKKSLLFSTTKKHQNKKDLLKFYKYNNPPKPVYRLILAEKTEPEERNDRD